LHGPISIQVLATPISGFGKIIIAETACAKHGAGAGAVGAVNQSMAAWFRKPAASLQISLV